MKTYSDILLEYLPENSVPVMLDWLENSNVQLKITRNRHTKLGDYRPPIKHTFHKISINHDLNKYNFLITLVHEFAHLRIWEKYKNRVKPHGKEWKAEYSKLLQPFLNSEIFPADIIKVLNQFVNNPSSTSINIELTRVLRLYDKSKNNLTLEELPYHSHFRIYNGVIFEKLEKLRKRYKCKRLDNNRIYLVNPMAEVDLVEK
jgi:hypothetical protein